MIESWCAGIVRMRRTLLLYLQCSVWTQPTQLSSIYFNFTAIRYMSKQFLQQNCNSEIMEEMQSCPRVFEILFMNSRCAEATNTYVAVNQNVIHSNACARLILKIKGQWSLYHVVRDSVSEINEHFSNWLLRSYIMSQPKEHLCT